MHIIELKKEIVVWKDKYFCDKYITYIVVINKGLMIYTGYTLQSHCYQSLCHTTDVIYLSVFNSSQSTKQVWPATSDLSKFSEKLIKIISQYDDINFHSTIYYNFKMKYKVVILSLFMAHWESISGCSGSKSPDGTVETTDRGLFGKKQLLYMVHVVCRSIIW